MFVFTIHIANGFCYAPCYALKLSSFSFMYSLLTILSCSFFCCSFFFLLFFFFFFFLFFFVLFCFVFCASGIATVVITKTCLYNFDALKPLFYIVKLGFTGVHIIFLISAQNIECGYSLKAPRRGGSNEYPQSRS